MRLLNRAGSSGLQAAGVDPPKWRVVGELRSSELPALFEWRDGPGLSGSPDAMRAVDEYLTTATQVPVTPTGPYVAADRHDEISAFCIAGQLLMGAIDVTGDTPKLPLPDLPVGAIP